ncbi:hypothetical protein SAMN05216602_4020 [Pseudomonas argentinensis]|uniref:Uncharacterized protein n=1 Tax=Phytopseudomonas argentinensis TaxID=289370 RepID=A0A1I3NV72_9GAMM|nr:hypothetical protein SAMN05216602_4020 [Pseudomonas argentinensis]
MACDRCFVTQGREGEKGSWCTTCGEKRFDVDDRVCGDCAHYVSRGLGGVCRKHLMGVSPGMHVTFKVEEGSCWTAIGVSPCA